MSQIDNLKIYLSQLVKYHIYMEAGTHGTSSNVSSIR